MLVNVVVHFKKHRGLNVRASACLFTLLAINGLAARADGLADNSADKVRPMPPPGISVSAADKKELETGLAELEKAIEELHATAKTKPALAELTPDVQIYYNAVQYALKYKEFFSDKEIPVAKGLLKQGLERARQLHEGKAPWTSATGLVTRGYVSKIDGSVQPYGLVVPASYHPNSPHHFRLDVWLHGRNETLSELNFINDRQRNAGEFTPANAFVLHPYGRYCNANKFAGEIDLLEVLAHAHRHYPIDKNRHVVRGFSMGGAACWQFAVHYPGLWAAAAPGAGFSETADFLKVFQKETVKPAWYEEKLWHLYDCTDYAINLFNCPTVAYSGAIDPQKQAADKMAEALKREGMTLVHLIGPNTAHSYHPTVKKEINERVDNLAAHGRNAIPSNVRFTTWTLRYNQMLWITVDGLEQHWERARVDAELQKDQVVIKTQNVSGLTLSMPAGYCPLDNTRKTKVVIDGQELDANAPLSDRSWAVHFRKAGRWSVVASAEEEGFHKRHGLQGPIDDAFMDSFLMVRPTGEPRNKETGTWVNKEMAHAVEHWRKQFRGEARVKDDEAVNDEDIASHNLVLWGDPASNKVLARIADKLPIRWDGDDIRLSDKSYPASGHIPVMIYPNPLNPKRYVVLNSGFTYREYDYLNNARQVPKLPDYAIIDVNVPTTSRTPGGIVTAGFFGEKWELKDTPK
ncbi:MAG: prolyl oligopeptidase family serine peptidase [Gemmataceae bacterium]